MVDTDSDFNLPHVVTQNPELFHYTNYAGFSGIVQSRSLWATHYLHLNDFSEIRVLRADLTLAATRSCLLLLNSAGHRSDRWRRAVAEFDTVELASDAIASAFVDALYGRVFLSPEKLGFEPFVASFCSHRSADQEYERNHGLLSQWRGYGGAGGYCLVFDSRELFRRLAEEFDAYRYEFAALSPVVYADDDKNDIALFRRLDECMDFWISRFVEYRKSDSEPLGMMDDFVSAATSYKHKGFREECEVRIAAVPKSVLTPESLRETQKGPKKFKTVQGPKSDLPSRSYVILFEDAKKPLPIVRVIVGPSRDQDANAEKARTLLGSGVPIMRSETPFLSQGEISTARRSNFILLGREPERLMSSRSRAFLRKYINKQQGW